MAEMSDGLSEAFLIAVAMEYLTEAHIASGSCSTHPGFG
jgi:hypothetical protein